MGEDLHSFHFGKPWRTRSCAELALITRQLSGQSPERSRSGKVDIPAHEPWVGNNQSTGTTGLACEAGKLSYGLHPTNGGRSWESMLTC